jgi:hypothetical protein
MPRNDDGEYELVLGNRQLLSGFFFVVVLFGIFFTMGYFVGRHSSAGTVNAGQPAAQQPPAETASVPASTTAGSSVPEPGKAQVMPVDGDAKASEPAVAAPVTTKPVETRPVESAETKSVPAAKPPVLPPPPKAAAGSTVTPSPGDIYLQVSAPAPAAAGSVVETLKRKGINAVLAPGPDSTTVRVLVGPLVPADIPDTRTQLENAGFKPFVRKY